MVPLNRSPVSLRITHFQVLGLIGPDERMFIGTKISAGPLANRIAPPPMVVYPVGQTISTVLSLAGLTVCVLLIWPKLAPGP